MKGIRAIRVAAFRRLQVLDAQGDLTPRRVVQEARNPKSPLHHALPWDWNKTTAATKWLEHQARMLIDSYRVTVTVKGVPVDRLGQVVAFVRDPGAEFNEQQYVGTARIRGETAQLVLEQELSRIQGYLDRGWGIAQQLGLANEYLTRLATMVADLGSVQEPKAKAS